MTCPFGAPHRATWHCFAVYALDYVLGFEFWPRWFDRALMAVLIRIEDGTMPDER